MSRRKFEPVNYAVQLQATGDYASDTNWIYHWTGSHWSKMEHKESERRALRWIADDGVGAVTATNARSVHETALRWLSELTWPKSHQTVIPVKNGYLHIEDGKLVFKDHDKRLGIQHVVECDYSPWAPTPLHFFRFIKQVLPDAAIRSRVQEYIGYTLLPDARFQRAQIWLGSGANGKGCLANIVQALHKRTTAVQLDALDGFYIAAAAGASLIYCDEAPQKGINEQVLKSLIAGELVQVREIYHAATSVRIQGKWLILANHVPWLTDQSPGFWRRFDIIPFDVCVPESERDPMLADRIIASELSGVLLWALEGVLRLLARGRFDTTIPLPMQATLATARAETNSVQAWVADMEISAGAVASTSKARVYDAYSGWCRANGMAPFASPKFWKRIPDILGTIIFGRESTSEGRIRTCNIELT